MLDILTQFVLTIGRKNESTIMMLGTGVLIGAFAPDSGISLGGINPRELHQTTQCVSAEYISNMIRG